MTATPALLDRAKPSDRKRPEAGGVRAEVAGHRMTADEYLALEREAEFKSEFLDGEMIAMPGASWNHTTIKDNLAGELRSAFKGGRCRALTSDLRVRIGASDSYVYPDVVVVCDPPQFQDGMQDNLLNPRAVVEVLSPSTERYDRKRKFEHYCQIESLLEIILIAQDIISIERFSRQPDGSWSKTIFDDADGDFELASVPVKVPMREIYADVDWTKPDTTPAN